VAKQRKREPGLADDLRAGLQELLRWVRGEETGAIVHRVIPSKAKARRAAKLLGLRNYQPNAVRRALKKIKAS